MRYYDIINKERIALCCKHYNTSGIEVAQKLRLNPMRLEAGKLTYKQLEKLSNHFGRSTRFFTGSDKLQLKDITSSKFRKLSNKVGNSLDIETIKTIERVEGHRTTYLARYEEFEYEAPPRFTPPRDTQDIKKVSKWLGLDELRLTQKKLNFADYRSLLEEKGILVFVSSPYAGNWHFQGNHDILGFSLYFDYSPVIWIKNDSHRQVSTLMHELRHLLNKGDNLDKDSEEIEADKFASELLLPQEVISEIIDTNNLSGDNDFLIKQCKKVKNRLDVCVQVTLRRLLELGFINKTAFNKCLKQSTKGLSNSTKKVRSSRKRDLEVLNIFGREYVGVILQAYENKEITIVKASYFLDFLNTVEFSNLRKRIYKQMGYVS